MTTVEEAMDTATSVVGGVAAAGAGYLIADGVDRYLASYDPSSSKPPSDKFTSNGSGALANVLNLGSAPDGVRIAAGIGMAALPAIGAAVVDDPAARFGLESFAVGAGVSFLKTVVNNVIMPLLVPADTSQDSLRKSTVVRLFPAECAAKINRKATPPLTSVSSTGSGALSAPQLGTGDVGPFAGVGGANDDLRPDAASALLQRQAAGVHDYPSVQNTFGTGEYDDVARALTRQAGLSDTAPMSDAVKSTTRVVAAAVPGIHPAAAVEIAGQAVANPAMTTKVVTDVLPHLPPQAVHEVSKRVYAHATRGAWQPGPARHGGPGPTTTQPSEEQCGCGVAAADLFALGFEDAAEEPLFGHEAWTRAVARKLDPADHRLNGKAW